MSGGRHSFTIAQRVIWGPRTEHSLPTVRSASQRPCALGCSGVGSAQNLVSLSPSEPTWLGHMQAMETAKRGPNLPYFSCLATAGHPSRAGCWPSPWLPSNPGGAGRGPRGVPDLGREVVLGFGATLSSIAQISLEPPEPQQPVSHGSQKLVGGLGTGWGRRASLEPPWRA